MPHAHLPFTSKTAVLVPLTLVLTLAAGLASQTPFQLANAKTRADPVAFSTNSVPANSVLLVENVGQWPADAHFQVWGGPAGTMWLAEDGIWITVVEPRQEETSRQVDKALNPGARWTSEGNEDPAPRSGVNIKLSFVDANPPLRLETFDRLETIVSYFIGNDPDQWLPDVPVWGGMRYVDIYPGVDFELGGSADGFAWRLVATDSMPGATPAVTSQPGQGAGEAVHLRIEGADSVRWEGDQLVLATAMGEQAIPWPAAPVPVAVELLAPDGRVDNLVIQPQPASGGEPGRDFEPLSTASVASLVHSTFLGGRYGDTGAAVAVDTLGRATVAGFTDSDNFPTIPGAFDVTANGLLDAFVVRLNSAGSALEYATFLGGSGTDGCQTLAVDAAGRANVAGYTKSPGFPTTPGAYDRSHNGSSDAFVLRLNSSGSALEFSTFVGGADWDKATAIAVDADGRSYVGGYGYSNDFPTTPGAFDRSQNGNRDGFLLRLNSVGSSLDYSSYLGGANGDWIHSIAVDASQRVYASGWTEFDRLPDVGGRLRQDAQRGRRCLCRSPGCRGQHTADRFVSRRRRLGRRLQHRRGRRRPRHHRRRDSLQRIPHDTRRLRPQLQRRVPMPSSPGSTPPVAASTSPPSWAGPASTKAGALPSTAMARWSSGAALPPAAFR